MSTFEYLASFKPELNKMVKELTQATELADFTKVFHHLFPEPGRQLEENIKSWLDLFFEENDTDKFFQLYDGEMEKVHKLFKKFQIPESPSNPERRFWACLFKIYPLTKFSADKKSYSNIFGFMKGFKATETSVVMMFQDPPKHYISNGFALDGVPCPTTKRVLEYTNYELRLVDFYANKGEKMERKLALTEDELQEIKNGGCSLKGWIDQKVLLINSMLIRIEKEGEKYEEEEVWKNLTRYLVYLLSRKTENVVFISCGEKARQVIDQNVNKEDQHLWIKVFHPSRERHARYSREEGWWQWWLPFINANFYLWESGKILIDWSAISEWSKGEDHLMKIDIYTKAFENMKKTRPYTADDIPLGHPNLERKDRRWCNEYWSQHWLTRTDLKEYMDIVRTTKDIINPPRLDYGEFVYCLAFENTDQKDLQVELLEELWKGCDEETKNKIRKETYEGVPYMYAAVNGRNRRVVSLFLKMGVTKDLKYERATPKKHAQIIMKGETENNETIEISEIIDLLT